MQPANRLTSSCRHCQFYRAEGRRGGQCHQLGVPVQSTWAACSLASPPFTSGMTAWNLEKIPMWRAAPLEIALETLETLEAVALEEPIASDAPLLASGQ